MKNLSNLKSKLDSLVLEKNSKKGLFAAPDPLQVAKKGGEFVCLLCALFAYGNAANIVNFLKKLDFSLLDKDENAIKSHFARSNLKYRFQSTADIAQIFITLRRLKQESSLESVFCEAYEQDKRVISGIRVFINKAKALNSYTSQGYDFFFGKPFKSEPTAPLKRYNMLLRWLVRRDELDLGLWRGIDKAHLLMPLDTHTHKVALKLGLMGRRSYDFKAVLELTETLRNFDPADPIKYDFALYRLGQSKEYLNL